MQCSPDTPGEPTAPRSILLADTVKARLCLLTVLYRDSIPPPDSRFNPPCKYPAGNGCLPVGQAPLPAFLLMHEYCNFTFTDSHLCESQYFQGSSPCSCANLLNTTLNYHARSTVPSSTYHCIRRTFVMSLRNLPATQVQQIYLDMLPRFFYQIMDLITRAASRTL